MLLFFSGSFTNSFLLPLKTPVKSLQMKKVEKENKT
jgi:hypothetical protein